MKNRQRSSEARGSLPGRAPRRFAFAASLAALLLTALSPGIALADEADDEEEEVDETPAAPARSRKSSPDAGLKKLQEIAAEAARKAQEKAAKVAKDKEKAAKDKAEKSAKKEKELTAEERALRGIVTVERGGQVIGMGAVLGGDGRILTSLSPLGPGNDLDVRFADGTVVRVKLGHHDRVWDLALLVPQTGKWQEGLTASSRDPVRQDATIRSFSAVRGKTNAVPMTLRGYRGLLGGDDTVLEQAIELGARVTPTDLGSPILDEEGRVVGVVGRGCAPNENRPCTPVAFGIPMSAIKGFLKTIPATAVPPAPWLGIQGVGESGPVVRGVRITTVHPASPADKAKLKGGDRVTGDMVIAVDGVPVTSPEALADAMKTHAVGEKVPLIIFSQGKYKQVTVHLRAAPTGREKASDEPAHPAELPSGAELPSRPSKLAPRRP